MLGRRVLLFIGYEELCWGLPSVRIIFTGSVGLGTMILPNYQTNVGTITVLDRPFTQQSKPYFVPESKMSIEESYQENVCYSPILVRALMGKFLLHCENLESEMGVEESYQESVCYYNSEKKIG